MEATLFVTYPARDTLVIASESNIVWPPVSTYAAKSKAEARPGQILPSEKNIPVANHAVAFLDPDIREFELCPLECKWLRFNGCFRDQKVPLAGERR
jgi:hypothetical protein